MATVNVVLRREDDGSGTLPLALKVYKNRKSSYIYLDQRIEERFWNSETEWITPETPHYKRLDKFLTKRLEHAEDILLDLEALQPHLSAKAIADKINPRKGNSFMMQAKVHLANLEKAKNFNRWTNESSLMANFKRFLPGGDISFQAITSSLLKQFHANLIANGAGQTHAMNHMVVIRLIFNQAIDAGLIDEKYYPFGRRKFKVKFPESNKIGLSPAEVKLLEEAQLDNAYWNHARNLWLFSFYFAGMRISDVFRLRLSDFHDGRLYYVMGKNGKAGSLKVPAKAQAIMDLYSRPEHKHDLVFPDLEPLEDISDQWEVKRKIKSRNKRINEWLDKVKEVVKITKKLDPHIARHTFGNISGDKISLKTLQQLYRHFHLTTTAKYQQNFSYDEMDQALDSVLEEIALAMV